MSYLVRTGRVLSAGDLEGESGQEYVHVRVEAKDQFWSEADPDMDASTEYSVMVFGHGAVQLSRLVELGARPDVVFAGRYIVRHVSAADGSRVRSHEVVSEHIGISLQDPALSEHITALRGPAASL